MRKRRYRGRAELGIAEVEFQLGRFHVAEKFAQEAVKHGAGWRARLVLANIHYRLRDYRRAIKLYERVLKHRPQNPEARRNLAAAKRRLNQ
jgi:tetratricopeptide (TPR) repeat protein